MTAGGDEGQLVREAVAGTLVLMIFGSPLVFCTLRVFVCACFYALVESLVADRIGLAA